jgi:hypothetical protein
MAVRTQQEINDLGFSALVNALGRQDALRFIAYVGRTQTRGEKESAEIAASEEILPAMTPDEIHEKIMEMHEPTTQGSFL